MRQRASEAPGERAVSPLLRAAQRLVGRIEAMERELEQLRADNTALRNDVREAVALFSQAGGRRSNAVDGRRRAPKTASGPRRRRRKAAKGRATPAAVTPEVVRLVIAKLGPSTASQIAQEITRAGETVSGRAIRFLAERAGAEPVMGEDGQRRYRL